MSSPPSEGSYLHNAMHVEGVIAAPPHWWTIIPWNMTIRTAGFERRVTNAAALIIHVPLPCGNSMPSARNERSSV